MNRSRPLGETPKPPARPIATLLALCLAVVGCDREAPKAEDHPAAAPAAARPVELVSAPADGEVAPIVQAELTLAKKEGRRLLVYVGASWCEPCQRFHKAATERKLDAAFPGVRFVEFDLDRDKARLVRAGYTSKLIPLFALPRADGTGSGEQIEGSIKGDGAVDQITPRLTALLAKPPP